MRGFVLELSRCGDEVVELDAQLIDQDKDIGDRSRLLEISQFLGNQKVTLEFIDFIGFIEFVEGSGDFR